MFLDDINCNDGVAVENLLFQKTAQFWQLHVLSFLLNPIHYQMVPNKVHTVKNPVHIVYSISEQSSIQARSTIATARNMISILHCIFSVKSCGRPCRPFHKNVIRCSWNKFVQFGISLSNKCRKALTLR